MVETAVSKDAPESGWDWREVLDLSVSINPLGPPPGVRVAIKRAIERVIAYPEKTPKELLARLGSAWGVGEEQILLGRGVTELVHFLARAWERETATVAVPAVPEVHRAYALARHAEWSRPESWPRSGLLLVGHPNNPTGQTLPFERLRGWLLTTNNAVVVDESYLEFCDAPSTMTLLAERRNLFVLRSMSGFYGLPGLRIGALVGEGGAIHALAGKREPWVLDVLGEAAALAALEDTSHLERSKRLVGEERAWLWSELQSVPTLTAVRSQANFYLAYVPGAAELCRWLAARKVVVRNCSGWPGIEGDAVRFAVRTRPENERLIGLLKEYFCG